MKLNCMEKLVATTFFFFGGGRRLDSYQLLSLISHQGVRKSDTSYRRDWKKCLAFIF